MEDIYQLSDAIDELYDLARKNPDADEGDLFAELKCSYKNALGGLTLMSWLKIYFNPINMNINVVGINGLTRSRVDESSEIWFEGPWLGIRWSEPIDELLDSVYLKSIYKEIR
jgi:hypothetical protein